VSRSLRVRIYRQGLGDCFLIASRDGDRKDTQMLVD
jgi:hypothetical protein